MPRKKSERISKPERALLRVEELEERIAPVIITSDPSTWIQGSVPDPLDPPDGRIDITNAWPDNPDQYWIFYLGNGQAVVNAADATPTDLIGHHITDVTITGSDINSALFILDYPNDPTPNADDIGFDVDAGTLWVQGNISVAGDIGLIEIDGLFGTFGGAQPFLTVNGTLGKLDVGFLTANVIAAGDINEIAVDMTLGGAIYNGAHIANTDTLIAANGNIGSIRVGVGLNDSGVDVDSVDVLGGTIGGNTTIQANADFSGAPGIIDLIEVRGGSILPGDLGQGTGDVYPTISAGPGGNVRFVRLDGSAYWIGAGNQMPITEVTVDPDSPLVERTIVDDSGGVMVISPQEIVFTDETTGADTTYSGSVSYLIIPVDPVTQGPGSVVARMSFTNSNSFSISGNVEIGEFRVDGNVVYAEGQALDFLGMVDEDGNPITNINDMPIESPADLTDLEGYAHEYFGGPGEADIYFVHAMSDFGGTGTTLPIILNGTADGDIVCAASDGDIIFIGASAAGGDIGATESISPYLIKSPLVAEDGDVLWVDSDPDVGIDAYGVEGSLTRYNTIQGVFAPGNIYGIRAGGAIGDVRSLGGDIKFISANANNARDVGSPVGVLTDIMPITVSDNVDGGLGLSGVVSGGYFHFAAVSVSGKVDSVIGDGIFGLVMSGTGSSFRDSLAEDSLSGSGDIFLVHVGEGTQPTWTYTFNAYPEPAGFVAGAGIRVAAGIYTDGSIDRVLVTGAGNGIFGDVIGNTNWDDTDFAVNRVAATNGAVIDGSFSTNGYSRISAVSAHARILAQIDSNGNLGVISASGAGSYISDLNTDAQSIHRITASAGSLGIMNSSIGANSGDGRLDLISTNADITNCRIFINGPGGTIETTGTTSRIVGTEIKALAGLKRLSTNALDSDDIYILTLGSLSRFDYIDDTDFLSGGIRTMIVRDDVTDSLINVAGPLKRLTVGGMIDNSSIMASGLHGNIGRVIVTGDITDSFIYSGGNITLVRSRTGSIDNTSVIASGSSDLDADMTPVRTARIGRVIAAGNIDGYIGVGDLFGDALAGENIIDGYLTTVKAGGNITADIFVGIADFGGNIDGNVAVSGYVGTVTAGGSITGDLNVGLVQTQPTLLENGDINADVSATGRVNRIQAGGNLAGNLNVGLVWVEHVPTFTDGDINADVSATGRVGTMKAGGNLSGNVAIGIIDSANDINALAEVASAKLGSLVVAGNVTGDVIVGSVFAANNINGNVIVPERVGTLKIGGQLCGDLFVGTADAGNDINGDVTFNARVAAVKAEGGVTGDIFIGSTYAGNVINGVLSGVGRVGSIISGAAVTGDIDITGNLGALVAEGDVGNPVDPADSANLSIGGNLGRLLVGTSDLPGNLLSNVFIGGNAPRITVTGAFPGSLAVVGNAGPIRITGAAGEDPATAIGADTFTIGGRLARLIVLDPNLDPADPLAVPSDLWASLDVGANLGRLQVQGDVEYDVNVTGNTGRMLLGRVFSDIHVMGNLAYFSSGSVPVENAPGDYTLVNTLPDPNGSLLVDGDVGVVI